MFRKYQHLERFGTTEVENIELGTVYVFPKIDGTNASVWLEGIDELNAGSRRRHLTLEDDNAEFLKWLLENDTKYLNYLGAHPGYILYGEWLVPHSLKTYRKDAWRKFYVFDVFDGEKYLHYDEYKNALELYGIDYIPCIARMENPSHEQLIAQLEKNDFLIEDGKGKGEGIVIKNYDYRNVYGRVTWAKIVSSEFKEKHFRQMGPTDIKGKKLVEQEIVNKYVTEALCEKVYYKLENFTSKQIPRLLNTVYYDLVREDCWNFIKDHKDPTIDFRKLRQLTYLKVKEHLYHLF